MDHKLPFFPRIGSSWAQAYLLLSPGIRLVMGPKLRYFPRVCVLVDPSPLLFPSIAMWLTTLLLLFVALSPLLFPRHCHVANYASAPFRCTAIDNPNEGREPTTRQQDRNISDAVISNKSISEASCYVMITCHYINLMQLNSLRLLFRGPQMGGQIRRGRNWRSWGSPEVPKYLFLKGFGTSGRKIGAPQKRQIQPRRI